MFTLVLDWLKPLITGFASAWDWLVSPIVEIPQLTHVWYGGLISYTTDAFSLTPISVISFGGLALLFIFGLSKTILDAIPLV